VIKVNNNFRILHQKRFQRLTARVLFLFKLGSFLDSFVVDRLNYVVGARLPSFGSNLKLLIQSWSQLHLPTEFGARLSKLTHVLLFFPEYY